MDLLKRLQEDVRNYINWDTELFYDGWEEIPVFLGATLFDAWMQADPEEAYQLSEEKRKTVAKTGNGKWLKGAEDGTYQIILATKRRKYEDVLYTYIHEIRHCLDYDIARQKDKTEHDQGVTKYYYDWSEFRAEYAATRMRFFKETRKGTVKNQVTQFRVLSSILGFKSADAVHGIMTSVGNTEDVLYFVSRYIGCQRAIRNLSMQLGDISPVFHLWHMAPTFITEYLGWIFYIGNEWDEMKTSSLDVVPRTYYYNMLVDIIESKYNEGHPAYEITQTEIESLDESNFSFDFEDEGFETLFDEDLDEEFDEDLENREELPF